MAKTFFFKKIYNSGPLILLYYLCLSEVDTNLEKIFTKKEYYDYKEIIMALHQTDRKEETPVINDGLYLSILNSCKNEGTEPLTLSKSFHLLEESNKFIPGGAQTYSKSWRPHIKGVSPIFLKTGRDQ